MPLKTLLPAEPGVLPSTMLPEKVVVALPLIVNTDVPATVEKVGHRSTAAGK